MPIPVAPAIDFGNIFHLLIMPHFVFLFSFIFIVSNHGFSLLFISRSDCSAIVSYYYFPDLKFLSNITFLYEGCRQFCFGL